MRADSIEVVRNSIKILSSEMVSHIFSVFYFIIVTRTFAKIELASLSVLSVITALGIMFTGLGIGPTLVKEIPKLIAQNEKKTVSAMVKSCILIHILFSFIAAIVVCLFSKQISLVFFKTTAYSDLIIIISTNIVIYKLLEDGEHLLTALQEFSKYSLVRIFEGVLIRIVAIIGYFLGGIKIYIGLILICQAILFCLIIFLSRDLFRIKSGFYSIKKLIVYSLPFYGCAYNNFAVQYGDQFIIGVFLKPEQLATYYVARRFYDYLSIIVGAVMRPLGTKIAEFKAQGIEKVENAIYRASRYVFFIVVPMACFVAVSSYPLLEIYGGKKYINAFPVLIILSITLIPSSIYSLIVSGVYVLGEPKETFKSEFVRGVVSFCIDLFFISLFGIIGASISRFFSFLGASVFTYYLLKKLSNSKISWKTFKDILLISLFVCSLIILFQTLYYNIYIFMFYLLFGMVIFIFLFWRSLAKEDIQLIQSLFAYLFPIGQKKKL